MQGLLQMGSVLRPHLYLNSVTLRLPLPPVAALTNSLNAPGRSGMVVAIMTSVLAPRSASSDTRRNRSKLMLAPLVTATTVLSCGTHTQQPYSCSVGLLGCLEPSTSCHCSHEADTLRCGYCNHLQPLMPQHGAVRPLDSVQHVGCLKVRSHMCSAVCPCVLLSANVMLTLCPFSLSHALAPATATAPAGSRMPRVSLKTSLMAADMAGLSTSSTPSTSWRHRRNVSAPTCRSTHTSSVVRDNPSGWQGRISMTGMRNSLLTGTGGH
jgi:hypothetical protein